MIATARSSLVLALGLLAAACAPTHAAGFINGHAYYRSHDHYRVRLRADGALLPPAWTNEAGPDAPRFVDRPLSRLSRAVGSPRVLRWDLRFVHAETGGALWSRTLALAPEWANDPLDVMLWRTVISLTTPYAVAPDLFGESIHATGVALRRAGPARVDGRDGRYLTFDVTRRVEDDLSTDRVTVVAVPFERPHRQRGRSLPAVAVFAHASAPDRHAAQLADFEHFVSRVDFAP